MADFDQDDLPSNLSSNPHFQDILSQVVSRRSILKSGAGLCGDVCGWRPAAGAPRLIKDENPVTPAAPLMGFTAVAANSLDQFTVPAGYTASVLYRWGDALFSHWLVWKGMPVSPVPIRLCRPGTIIDGICISSPLRQAMEILPVTKACW